MPSGYSVLEYQGDGTTTVFAVNFTLGYLKKSDIYCRVGDEVDGTGNPAYRTLEDIPGDPGRMRILGAVPTTEQKVLFRRITSKTILANDYADGAVLDDTALNDSFRQQLMIAHELLDGFSLSTIYSDIDLSGHKITNVVTDPNDPTSMCNVQYVGQAPLHSAAAAASAIEAENSASDAESSATAAAASAALATSNGAAQVTLAQQAAVLADQHADRADLAADDAEDAAVLAAQHAASIDPQVLPVKQLVRAVATTNCALSGLLTIDGVVLAAGDRVLVTAQTVTTQNGLYTASVGAWSRSVDADAPGELFVGSTVSVREGTDYGGSTWQVTAPTGTITPGTSVITFDRSSFAILSPGTVTTPSLSFAGHSLTGWFSHAVNQVGFAVAGVLKILSNTYGLLVGTTNENPVVGNVPGVAVRTNGQVIMSASGLAPFQLNRIASDGGLMGLSRDGVSVASVTVAAGVVTWGTFCGSHWSRLPAGRTDLLAGTIVDVLDRPVVWPNDDQAYLPMCDVSTTVASRNVYGVFHSADTEDAYRDVNIASIGAYKIRMQAGQTPQIGDWIESAGDGTGRVQSADGDATARIGKVTGSWHIDEYSDGSFTIPCTLHCG